MKTPKSPSPILSLTPKEKSVLQFIEHKLETDGICPSYMEIKSHFGLASFNSVQNYLKQLSQKGYILIQQNQKRSIQILASSNAASLKMRSVRAEDKKVSMAEPLSEKLLQARKEEVLSLPLLGKVAAGAPLEAQYDNETVDVPPQMVRNPQKTFALIVSGQSMIEEGIFDGDVILVQKQTTASNGDLVVASVDNEATVKKFFMKKDPSPTIELRPANSTMKSMFFSPEKVEIKGILVGLLRKF